MSDTGAVADALETADLVLEGVGPAAVLRAGVGRPRGLWSDPHGWSAWFGEAAVLTATGSDRFDAIRRAARALGLSASDRLFGGFAFHDVGDTVPRWEGFPAARFVLPTVEARGEGSAVRLTVRADAAMGASRRLAAVAAAVSAAQAGSNGSFRAAAAARPPADGRSGAHEGWNANVHAALEEIAAGRLEKVVLARALDIPAVRADPVPVAMALRADEPGAHTFLFEPTPGHAFLGAAPESIAEVTAGVLRTTAVAGSAPRGADPEDDAALAAALLASAKDRAEQDLVVRDIAQRLAALVDDLDVERGPHVIRFARIQHLETLLSGSLRPGVDILSVLAALHPTPAVGGEPRAEALAFIRRAEGFRRGWYAGPVGWFEPGGDGSFAPALRSALRREGEGWRLFAGAGIVAGSEPEKEWDETAVKLEPVLAALRRARS
ncbi:MAG TPA: isochorismate synthase [Longimicrobiales bacterium]|nr:isochorismate synthase [Longimicrobiales bacterium]